MGECLSGQDDLIGFGVAGETQFEADALGDLTGPPTNPARPAGA